jgi:hypothetical protein
MQVYGNGHCVNVEIEYRSPFVKVWSDKNDKVYYVSCPYEQRLQVANTVGDIIEEQGKKENFWDILGDVLNSKFGVINFNSQKEKSRKKKSKTKDYIPKINMTATYAKVLYKGDTVDVIFSNNQETNTITFKRRKSWSHKKYVDKAMSESGITPSWNFRYGWEISA